MSARYIPPPFEGRAVQAPGMMRHGPFPGSGPPATHRHLEQLPPELAHNKIAVQVAEIERLIGDNRSLAASHVVLREELVASQNEIQRVKAHIRSIQTESDIQIKMLMDKITKMEADIRGGESVKKDLQEAHKEAQGLVIARQEVSSQIQQATQDMQKAHEDVKKLPEMHAELESLRQEHQRLRATFEYEKGLNMEQVEKMQGMERNLIGMAREVEKLRADVSNAEKRAHAPSSYGSAYMNQDHAYPPPPPPPPPQAMQGSGPYNIDPYGRPHAHMGITPPEGMNPYSGATPVGGPPPPATLWGGPYDPSALARR